MGVPFVGGVVCLGWFRFLRSHVLSAPSEPCVLSIRDRRRPDRSCGEVSLVCLQKQKKRRKEEQKVACWLYFVFGSVSFRVSVDVSGSRQ